MIHESNAYLQEAAYYYGECGDSLGAAHQAYTDSVTYLNAAAGILADIISIVPSLEQEIDAIMARSNSAKEGMLEADSSFIVAGLKEDDPKSGLLFNHIAGAFETSETVYGVAYIGRSALWDCPATEFEDNVKLVSYTRKSIEDIKERISGLQTLFGGIVEMCNEEAGKL